MTVPTISVPSAITGPSPWVIQRWTRASIAFASATVLLLAVLCLGPLWLQAGTVDRLTTLFIYVILAVMWNALAGYAGLVSIGHQAFFGLGAYAMVRLADAGFRTNAEMDGEALDRFATPDEPGRQLLAQAAAAMITSTNGTLSANNPAATTTAGSRASSASPWPMPAVCTTMRADSRATVVSSAVRAARGEASSFGGTR